MAQFPIGNKWVKNYKMNSNSVVVGLFPIQRLAEVVLLTPQRFRNGLETELNRLRLI